MRTRLLIALVLALALAGCGGAGGSEPAAAPAEPAPPPPAAAPAAEGDATLWITRDRGETVLLETRVQSGRTVMRTLQTVADVETRYAGRYVQGIDGLEGSLARQQDWFFSVNGIEPDVGAAELKVRPGDVVWWDFRSWQETREEPVVVGAFPEPLVHGWNGRTRPVEIRFPASLRDAAEALAALVGEGAGRATRTCSSSSSSPARRARPSGAIAASRTTRP
ncbi:MAG: DUF4430 domain-containing protein [Thermoleophilia bacterium]